MSEGETERKRVWKTPPGVALCAEGDIADPGARGFVLQIGEAFFHGFVVRKDGVVAGWVDRCPHAGFPIAVELDRYLTPDGGLILCGWHGAVFEPLTGECKGGPCAGGRLTPWPVVVVTPAPTAARPTSADPDGPIVTRPQPLD